MSTRTEGRPRASANGRVSPEALLARRPRRSWSPEAWVGLFVIIGVAAGLAALFALTDAADFRGRDIVLTTVADAGGLRNGDPVRMRGVDIGRVDGFRMVPGAVEIRLELEGDHAVPADSRVVLRSNGLLGGRVVDVIPGAARVAIEDGQRLDGSSAAGLIESADGLGDQATMLLARTQDLLSERNVTAIGESAAGLRGLVAELSRLAGEQRVEMSALAGSLRRTASEIEAAATSEELDRAVRRLDGLSASLARSASSLETASASLASVLRRIEAGEGTLGRLSADASLYDNLNRATLDLGALLRDVQQNPRRYVDLSLF